MIPGLQPDTEGWKNLKAWLEERMNSAQAAINSNLTSDEETRYLRGRRDIANELLDALAPTPVTLPPPERKGRDRSNY